MFINALLQLHLEIRTIALRYGRVGEKDYFCFSIAVQ